MPVEEFGKPFVSIGLPCYNRPEGLARSLDCLLAQSYPNFEVVVSDNCSPDPEVERVGLMYAEKDSRIRYIRQPENRGPEANFRYALGQANGPLFMWVSDDDVWDPDYIAECVELLLQHPDRGLAFTHYANVNPDGQPYRDVISPMYVEGPTSARRIYRFLVTPGRYGIASMVYGMYRTEQLRKVMSDRFYRFGCHAGDMTLLLGVLGQCGGVAISPRVLLKKTITQEHWERLQKKPGALRPYHFKKRFGYHESLLWHPRYLFNHLMILRKTRYAPLVVAVLVMLVVESVAYQLVKPLCKKR